MIDRVRAGWVIFLLSAALAACASGATPTALPATAVPTAIPTATAAVAPTRSGTSGELVPLAPAECEELRVLATGAVGLQFTPDQGPFLDYISGRQGTGCVAIANGTGETLNNFGDQAQKLRAALTASGWIENQQYAADGPTSTSFAVEKGAALVLVSVGWEPAPGTACPADQPISACEVPPAQQLYTLMLSAAQR